MHTDIFVCVSYCLYIRTCIHEWISLYLTLHWLHKKDVMIKLIRKKNLSNVCFYNEGKISTFMINYKYKSLLLPRAIPTKSHCLPFCANAFDQNIFSFCESCKTRPRHATESHAVALLMLKMYLKNKKEAKAIYCSMCFKKVWMRMNKKKKNPQYEL